jgi:hypothetical protein
VWWKFCKRSDAEKGYFYRQNYRHTDYMSVGDGDGRPPAALIRRHAKDCLDSVTLRLPGSST